MIYYTLKSQTIPTKLTRIERVTPVFFCLNMKIVLVSSCVFDLHPYIFFCSKITPVSYKGFGFGSYRYGRRR